MTEPRSRYMPYLPPIFHESGVLDGYLLAFEKLLNQAAPEDTQEALQTIIGRSDSFLRPLPTETGQPETPDDFLPWLASWLALTLRNDMSPQVQRRFIQEIVPLYQIRGTKAGLKRMLEIFLGEGVDVTIYDRQAQTEEEQQNGSEFAYQPPAYYFQVKLKGNSKDKEKIRRDQQIAEAIIEQEKPAHTYYGLQITLPSMRLLSERLAKKEKEPTLILGKNTLLGSD